MIESIVLYLEVVSLSFSFFSFSFFQSFQQLNVDDYGDRVTKKNNNEHSLTIFGLFGHLRLESNRSNRLRELTIKPLSMSRFSLSPSLFLRFNAFLLAIIAAIKVNNIFLLCDYFQRLFLCKKKSESAE